MPGTRASKGEENREVEPIADDSCIFDGHDGGREGDGVLEHVTDRRPDGLLETGRPLGIRRTRNRNGRSNDGDVRFGDGARCHEREGDGNGDERLHREFTSVVLWSLSFRRTDRERRPRVIGS